LSAQYLNLGLDQSDFAIVLCPQQAGIESRGKQSDDLVLWECLRFDGA